MTGKELDQFMEFTGIGEKELADLLGVTHGAVRHWLNDRRDIPKPIVKVINVWKSQPQLVALWEN